MSYLHGSDICYSDVGSLIDNSTWIFFFKSMAYDYIDLAYNHLVHASCTFC